jgi:hypothetical protein
VTPREMVVLTRYVKACCPQQQIDEYTPDAWHDLIGHLALADCREAVKTVVGRQPFVAPAEIAGEVSRIRAARLHDFQYVPVPGDDDTRVYLEALRDQREAVASGRREPAPAPALPPGATDRGPELRRLVARAFKRPPRAEKA